jgi:hypothetical protein
MSENADFEDNSQANDLTPPQLSQSDIFAVLQNDRRRYILEILRSQGNQSVHFLSEEIARLEAKPDDPKSSAIRGTYISLIQNHIPYMEKMNLIEYDTETDLLKLLPASKNFTVYVETVKKGDIPWSYFYVGLSFIILVGSIAIYFELFPWITSFQWTPFLCVIFVVTSIVYWRHSTNKV